MDDLSGGGSNRFSVARWSMKKREFHDTDLFRIILLKLLKKK
jgi:hypothetical protein